MKRMWESCGISDRGFSIRSRARNFSSHEIASVYAAFAPFNRNSARKLNARGCVRGLALL